MTATYVDKRGWAEVIFPSGRKIEAAPGPAHM